MRKLATKAIQGIITLLIPTLIIYFINIKSLIPSVIFISLISYLFYTFIKNRLLKLLVTFSILTLFFFNFLIIPLSFYTVWFEHIKSGISNTSVTRLLVYFLVYTWTVFFTILVDSRDIKNFFYIASLSTLVCLILFKSSWIFILFLVLFILGTVMELIKSRSMDKIFSVICLLTTILIFSFLVKNDNQNEDILLNRMSYDFRSFISKNFPKYDLLISIPGLNDVFKNSRGKPPILSSKNLFKIKGKPNERYYIRMASNIDPLILNKDDYRVKYKISNPNYITLTVMSDYLPILPTTINTVDIDLFNIEDIDYNTFKLDNPLPYGSEIKLFIGDKNSSISNLETIKGINPEILNLAVSLKGVNSRETANNIRQYLHNNYTYTLDTKESSDLIYEFLFNTKEGFCVHFTKTFIMLATLNGIECREISGYLIDIPRRATNRNKIGEAYITGNNSHLWPEVKIDGMWETFEVTPTYIINKSDIKIEKSKIVVTESSQSVKEENLTNKYLLFLILIPISSIYFIVKPKKNILLKIVKLSLNKGVPHPEDIGWVKWSKTVNNNYLSDILELNYTNRELSKIDRVALKKIYTNIKKKDRQFYLDRL